MNNQNTNSKLTAKELISEIEKLNEKYQIKIFDYIALEEPLYFYKIDERLPKHIQEELDTLFPFST